MIFKELENKIKDGYQISYDELKALIDSEDRESLYNLANSLRIHFDGEVFETCSIINARSGKCSEDCKWCSQSKFYNTGVDIYPLISAEEALEAAKINSSKGVNRFSLVTSGRAVSKAEIDRVVNIYNQLEESVDIDLCASMGLMKKEELQKLYDAGCRRYHCNLETAPSFFSKLCTTHTIDDKIVTIKAAREVGMSICSGGIIGMGETQDQRIEFAFKLREIGVDSIPVNILNPIKGTPLENCESLTDEEILTTFAIFKIVNPHSKIRLAGGRSLITHLQRKAIRSGVYAAIVGNMLTTEGDDELLNM